MGTLRFFLALSIIVAHAGPIFGIWLIDARLAVQMFYLLSGFSMAFVWQGRYATSRSPLRTFFIGRALRIYPQYFLVLFATILLSVYAWLAFGRHPIATAVQHPVHGIGGLWIYLQQLVLVGMESQFFLQRAADGTLAFCQNFHQGTQPPLHYYMFVPQAWMLSLQLVFYLLVPLLLPRPRLCVAVLVLSFAARLKQNGLLAAEKAESVNSTWELQDLGVDERDPYILRAIGIRRIRRKASRRRCHRGSHWRHRSPRRGSADGGGSWIPASAWP
jgi:peptidoglycan/LPS O-acetylase OafA/YrhL